jgi:4-amino-4-deoxy-L-arabinose transferase-like glycosyltransferase
MQAASDRVLDRPASVARRFGTVLSILDFLVRRHENLVLSVSLIVITTFSLLFAWRRPFWMDEYLVLQTALAGSPTALWNLMKGAPLSVDPPVFHFLVLYFLRIFGPTEFSARLPSVLAYTLMSLLLYRFVRKYADVYTGLAVLTLCFACGTFQYAYQARPYALVLAADTLALLCWSNIVDTQHTRKLALSGLFLGVAVAVGSHWFGGLVLVPLVFGEVVRSWQTRKIDVGVWTAFVAGGTTLVAYLPLLKAASEYRSLPWRGAYIWDIFNTFQLVMQPCLVPLTILMIILALARFMFGAPPPELKHPSIPSSVFICMVLLALTPFPGFLIGRFVSHSFYPRYVILCTIGLLFLVSLTIRNAVGRSAVWMGLSVLIIGGCATLLQYREFLSLPSGGDASILADVTVFSAEPSLPIVPSDIELLLRLEAHGAASLRTRCVYATDPSSVRILHHDTELLCTRALRRWTRLPIRDLSSFLSVHPRFYVIGPINGTRDWVVRRMLEEHADIALQGAFAGEPVYLVAVNHAQP